MTASRILSWRMATAILLVAAAIATIVRVLNAGALGRVGGVLAAAAIVGVAMAVLREQAWAWGATFLLGICWSWAAIALRVQDVLDVGEMLMWLGWSVAVIFASVRGRDPSG